MMRNWSIKYVFPFLLSCISFSSCAQPHKEETPQDIAQENWDLSIQGSFVEHNELILDSIEISAFFKKYPQLKNVEDDLLLFYSGRNYAYAWFDDGKLIEQANNLYNRIINLENEGVYSKIPYQHTLDSLFNLSGIKQQKKPNISLELMLTADYFVFSQLNSENTK